MRHILVEYNESRAPDRTCTNDILPAARVRVMLTNLGVSAPNKVLEAGVAASSSRATGRDPSQPGVLETVRDGCSPEAVRRIVPPIRAGHIAFATTPETRSF